MRHKSLHQKFDHVLRLARRRTLAGSPTAYKLYLRLCDNQHKFVPVENHPPLATQLSRVAGYKLLKEMGWSSVGPKGFLKATRQSSAVAARL